LKNSAFVQNPTVETHVQESQNVMQF